MERSDDRLAEKERRKKIFATKNIILLKFHIILGDSIIFIVSSVSGRSVE